MENCVSARLAIGLLLVLERQTDRYIGGHDCDLCIYSTAGLNCVQHILIDVVLLRLRANDNSGREITILPLFPTAVFGLFFSSATNATVRLVVPRAISGTCAGAGTGYVSPLLPTSLFSLFSSSATIATVRHDVTLAGAGTCTGEGTGYVAARIDTDIFCVGLRTNQSCAHCAGLSVCPTSQSIKHCACWPRRSRRCIGGG